VFTLSAPVNVPCVYNLNESFYSGNYAMGEWMAKALGGKGSIFLDQGIAGLAISKQIENGFLAGLKKYGPNIKVVGKYTPVRSRLRAVGHQQPPRVASRQRGTAPPALPCSTLKAAGQVSRFPRFAHYNGSEMTCLRAGP
jgi:hypothetical protein